MSFEKNIILSNLTSDLSKNDDDFIVLSSDNDSIQVLKTSESESLPSNLKLIFLLFKKIFMSLKNDALKLILNVLLKKLGDPDALLERISDGQYNINSFLRDLRRKETLLKKFRKIKRKKKKVLLIFF